MVNCKATVFVGFGSYLHSVSILKYIASVTGWLLVSNGMEMVWTVVVVN